VSQAAILAIILGVLSWTGWSALIVAYMRGRQQKTKDISTVQISSIEAALTLVKELTAENRSLRKENEEQRDKLLKEIQEEREAKERWQAISVGTLEDESVTLLRENFLSAQNECEALRAELVGIAHRKVEHLISISTDTPVEQEEQQPESN
jgi:regulator of replication initiation timing